MRSDNEETEESEKIREMKMDELGYMPS